MDYSPEDRGFGLTQLASRDSEKANELRKKLEARQALNAAAAAAQVWLFRLVDYSAAMMPVTCVMVDSLWWAD